jgi:hypothetical protein
MAEFRSQDRPMAGLQPQIMLPQRGLLVLEVDNTLKALKAQNYK